jgi:hypothetical protein
VLISKSPLCNVLGSALGRHYVRVSNHERIFANSGKPENVSNR